MKDIYQRKIDIVVQTIKPEIFNDFWDGFKETTSKFGNLRLYVYNEHMPLPNDPRIIDVQAPAPGIFGGPEVNKIFRTMLSYQDRDLIAYCNDDLWFTEGWLEDVVKMMDTYWYASPGYIECQDKDYFLKIVEKTKNEAGYIDLAYGAFALMRWEIFKKIGMLAENLFKGGEDLDWALRIYLNNLPAATSKKVTVCHRLGSTHNYNSKTYQKEREDSKQNFYDRNGYWGYKKIKDLYRSHDYFRDLIKDSDEHKN